VLPGGPGHSHQSVRDISAVGSVPHLVMAEPSLEEEVHALLDYFVNLSSESAYLRLVSVKWPVPFRYPSGQQVRPGRGWLVRDGDDLVVFGYGPWLLSNAWHAAVELEKTTGVTTRLINLPWLNRVESSWLAQIIGTRRAVMTLDNHYVHGGQGAMIAAAVAELGLSPAARVTRIGLTALPECGTNDEVLAHHGLDVASFTNAFRAAAEKQPRQGVSQLA
jgi:transketolase